MQKMRSANVWKGTEGFGVAEGKYHVRRMGGGWVRWQEKPNCPKGLKARPGGPGLLQLASGSTLVPASTESTAEERTRSRCGLL